MNKVTINIDGRDITVKDGATILEAAKELNIQIPTLCYHPDQSIKGSCRVCTVEVEGIENLQASCCTLVRDGMKVRTNTKRVRDARKKVLELIIASHNDNCLACVRSENCELQALSKELSMKETRLEKIVSNVSIQDDNPSIVRDSSKCIKCGRCIEVCHDVQGVGAIYNLNRSFNMEIGTPLGKDLSEISCVYCGQCINVCPVGAIYEKTDIDRVWKALEDEGKHVVVQVAPAVRVSIGEEFGMPPGSILTKKMVAVLRALGFNKVFDTDFTADLTILEEGNEFLHRLNGGGTLPMFTSCSPGWVRYIENFYPELLDHVSSCKSPQQMFGALAKTYYAEKENVDPKDIVVVSIMPCTAKKAEAARDEMIDSGYQDVDIVLTTRELGRMIKESGIDMISLPEEEFDEPLGISTGAAVIFGASGGVMEAALRTVYEVVTGEELENIDFVNLRGIEGFKEAVVKVGDLDVKVAVVNSLMSAKKVLDMVKEGKADYHFVEVMCCPGGCIGGGGQPIPGTNEIKRKRVEGIYNADKKLALRKSHENPAVKVLYEEFLEKPLGEKSHHLLHTHYVDRSN
ncbi:NADH-dependent [FeFe] hydrogenase, group A6 [Alkaliphilus serpentinus]|uniref:2Fe-2S iron-sulfur cluster binding domain-containing protein n=1 Tax=Alkaliphilus serpentinus TaxID=1482731 RepID=A0A833HPC9_9FIRM|nr:NADH-dependent [FeFe] hydrogenase, group A6 [Alkaliphilus serpentinus]KAB3530703.1 2Fe-2S iron-sulfur cluster binding domain-containing protein [Alkaliphilus serpentinus]